MSHTKTSRRAVASTRWTTLLLAIAAAVVFVLHVAASPTLDGKLPEVHHCGFDALHARTRNTRVIGVSRVVQPALPERNIDAVAIPAADSSAAWQPIRIRVFTEDLDHSNKYCMAAGQSRPNFEGGKVTCTSDDILTSGKKTVLTDFLVPSAIQLHEDRLNVQRVDGNIVVEPSSITSDSICGQFTIPASHKTTGVSDADFVLYMSAGPTSGNTIAWATYCQVFDNNRPSVGVSNVSPKYISADPQTVRVITHELLHALGFIYDTFVAQGMASSMDLRGKGLSPVLISPNVVAKTREQYGCTTQTYMELEDEGGSGTTYSHWKRRSAKDELMAGISGVGHYTALTIAAMEDMGFYKGNYANAEPMAYGQNAGCTLATSKCVLNGVSQFTNMFCAPGSNNFVCSSDYTGLGSCLVYKYKSALPSYFQYFSDPTMGGDDSDALMDFCPFVQGYSNTNCTTDGKLGLLGNVYGVNSRCFNVPTGFWSGGHSIAQQLAICANVECDAATSTYGVKVSGASSYTTCTPGATLALSSLSSSYSSGTLTCPGYDDVCIGQANATAYAEYTAILSNTTVIDTGDSAAAVLAPTAFVMLMAAVSVLLVF